MECDLATVLPWACGSALSRPRMLAPGLLLDVVLRLMCVRRSGGILHALSDCMGRAGSSPYHAEEMLVKVFAGSVRCCDLAGIA